MVRAVWYACPRLPETGCCAPGQAAFELLAELMHHDSASLNEGVGLLMALHFNLQRPGVLNLTHYSNMTPHSTRRDPPSRSALDPSWLHNTLSRARTGAVPQHLQS